MAFNTLIQSHSPFCDLCGPVSIAFTLPHLVTSLTSSAPLLTHFALTTLASLLLLEHSRPSPASGPLPLPFYLLKNDTANLLVSFTSLLKFHLLREISPGQPT